MTSCGIWRAGRVLVVVVISPAGRASRPMRVPIAQAEALAEHLERIEIVLPQSLVREPIGRAAAATGRMWVAPTSLIDVIRTAAALSPRATAAMLGRLPRSPSLRAQLHRYGTDPRQLRLL